MQMTRMFSSHQGRPKIAHRFNGGILGEGDIAVPLGTKEDSIDFGTGLSPRWGFRLLSLSALSDVPAGQTADAPHTVQLTP